MMTQVSPRRFFPNFHLHKRLGLPLFSPGCPHRYRHPRVGLPLQVRKLKEIMNIKAK
uniref:Uncharacterized protein n=1 Tax=Lotus japonicus TaxID=34305 RepID=I3T755_LOTJA|nr:unknown [Lotus japonicus]